MSEAALCRKVIRRDGGDACPSSPPRPEEAVIRAVGRAPLEAADRQGQAPFRQP
jgi:hypothetical protein